MSDERALRPGADATPRRGARMNGWTTVTNYVANCEREDCLWATVADTHLPADGKRVVAAARQHAAESGHTVQIERGQMTQVIPEG